MKDTELRGLVLQVYYEKRRSGYFLPVATEFLTPITEREILDISSQLAQHGLLDWKPLRGGGYEITGMGTITARGIDVVEGHTTTPNFKVELVQNTINITGSTNVVVGDSNVQEITQGIGSLVQLIDSSDASGAEKNEAKGLLRKFLEHPLVAAIAGGAVSKLGG